METRPVEIDLDIHKLIEIERRSFDEPDLKVLRRLLGLENGKKHTETFEKVHDIDLRDKGDCAGRLVEGKPWMGKGVLLPHGTRIRMEYNGVLHEGQIEDGEWVVGSSRAKSPSDAAGKVSRTRGGNSPSLNGWIYWKVLRPGDKNWRLIDDLRKRRG